MKLYVVIRSAEDGPDLDLSAVAWSKDRALEKALHSNSIAPGWAAENPILRVAVFELQEVEP